PFGLRAARWSQAQVGQRGEARGHVECDRRGSEETLPLALGYLTPARLPDYDAGCSPRRRTRGRIEVSLVPARHVEAHAVLHGVAAVAALKFLSRAGTPNARPQVLHGVAAVAALKLDSRPTPAAPGPWFSTASQPWPH